MNLVLDYESSALAAPQSFLDAMQTAVNILDSTILNNITVTIEVGYNDFLNNTITGLGASAEGGDLSGSYVSYSSLRAALASGHPPSSVSALNRPPVRFFRKSSILPECLPTSGPARFSLLTRFMPCFATSCRRIPCRMCRSGCS